MSLLSVVPATAGAINIFTEDREKYVEGALDITGLTLFDRPEYDKISGTDSRSHSRIE